MHQEEAHPTSRQFMNEILFAINASGGLCVEIATNVVLLNVNVRNLLDATILSSCVDAVVALEGEETEDAGFSSCTALCTYVVGSCSQGNYA